MNNAEIDRLVAEKVMGWKIQEKIRGYPDLFEHGRIVSDWEPTVEWNDAGQVVDRMKELGYFVSITCSIIWDVEFIDKTGRIKNYCIDDSVQRAICLAALKAVGVEVET